MRALLLFLSLATAAAAQPAPADTTLRDAALPEVSVVATRVAVLPAEAPARVTVLGPETIQATGSRTVADLLERASTVSIRRYGPGGLASLSLRGTGASQTLVLLDGHRIADPQLGQLDVSLLPTVLVDRAELMHGAGSALHGTDGIGGVLNLRTRRPEADRLELSSTVGAFGERRAAGLAATEHGRFRLLAAAEATTEDGDFPYFNPNLGLSGETARRAGADRSLGSVFLRTEADLGRTTAHIAAWAGAADRGVPGSIGAPTAARQEDRHLRLWGGTTTRTGWGTLRAGGLVQHASLRYNADEGRTWIGSGEVEVQRLAGRWLLATGVTGGFGSADHPRLAEGAQETRLGAFAAATGDFGSVLLYPALRADAYLRTGATERALAAFSPRLGANWRPVEALPLRLKAAVGSAFRAPTFNDRFWTYADPAAPGGDPGLRPERGWTTDFGVHTSHGPFEAEVTGFAAWMRDQIVWLPSAVGLYAPLNIGRTHTRGLEATARAGGLPLGAVRLGGFATAALTDARDRSRPGAAAFDRPLPYVPRQQLKGGVSARAPLAARTALRLDLGGRYVGTRPVTADGTIRQPAYFVADGQLRLERASDAFSTALTLSVDNALDARYTVMRGYPMPPRHARLHLSLSF